MQIDSQCARRGKQGIWGLVILVYFETGSYYVYSPWCSGTFSVDQTGLEFTELYLPGLKVRATTSGYTVRVSDNSPSDYFSGFMENFQKICN